MPAVKAFHVPTLPWVRAAPDSPYFMTEEGLPWTPIGQNDAITWPELKGVFARKDLATAETYLETLAAHGVTCLRLMMEYCQVRSRYFEHPAGRFAPRMVQLWDDLFTLCGKHGLRVLLTPCDTFFMWIRWHKHPYNQKNGGPCADRSRLLNCRDTRQLIKARLAFAAERWGGSGVLFAWDLWNEIHPAYGGDSAAEFDNFIQELSDTVRETEMRCFGRTHPQTVSMFGPNIVLHPEIPDAIYRHPALDFASTHLYEEGSIDFPQNTVDSAISFGRLVKECIDEIPLNRPYFDSEHGPIHSFKDHHITLPEVFDDEYFRHMQWAHLASGGAGGGMRWPNRHPHSLTAGMRQAQQSLAGFTPLIDWVRFHRQNNTDCLQPDVPGVVAMGCGDDRQAVLYLIRRDTLATDGRLQRDAEAVSVRLRLPGLAPGEYRVTFWSTAEGLVCEERVLTLNHLLEGVPVRTDLAIAIAPVVT